MSNNEPVRVGQPQQVSGLCREVLSFLRRGRLGDDAVLRRAEGELAVLILGAFNAKEVKRLCTTLCRHLNQEVPQLDIALARPIAKHSQRHRTNLFCACCAVEDFNVINTAVLFNGAERPHGLHQRRDIEILVAH